MKKDDFDLLRKWHNDPEVMQFWYGRDKPRPLQWIRKHYTPAIQRRKDCAYWMIELEGKQIGYICNTAQKNDEWECLGIVEIDILIGDKSKWEKGLGLDALKAMIGYAFNIQKAERVFLVPRVNNLRAIHVYKKAGFKKEGILRHYEKFEGKWIDGVMMSILRKEFKRQ